MVSHYLKIRILILLLTVSWSLIVYCFISLVDRNQLNCESPLKHLEKRLYNIKNKQERADLSKLLNSMAKNYYMLKCSLQVEVAATGGWCSKHLNLSHITDEGLAQALARMFTNQSIGSFGEGPGYYQKYLMNTGFVKVYDGYDGSPHIESVTNNQVKYLDLTIPHFGLQLYDWIFSIEVAEHIPQQYEDVYLSNIIRHARHGVVLSWAIPDQRGLEHVNPKTHDYVIAKLASLCFEIDDEKSTILRNNSKFAWLKTNIMVFHRHKKCPLNEGEA